MQLIEKIEIKYFRSFGEYSGEIIEDIKDLNLFSGANDSGKSNILRALNLFFNDEVSSGNGLDFKRDFSLYRSKQTESHVKPKKFIEITIHFKIKKTDYRDSQFAIRKRWDAFGQHSITEYSGESWKAQIYNAYQDPDIRTKFPEDYGQRTKSINRFLNSIFFFYVPAIKDNKFYSHLFGKLLSKIEKNEKKTHKTISKKIGEKIIDLENVINDYTKEKFNLENIGNLLEINFSIPDILDDFFSAFDMNTTEKGLNGMVSIKSRGDGIQAQLIPKLLLELEAHEKEVKNPFFIWGFEEPENSYEYKTAQKLANLFESEYSKSRRRQLFITTHSFNFLSLDGDNVSTYRIFKDDKYNSKVIGPIGSVFLDQQKRTIATNKIKLGEELGFFTLTKDLDRLFKEKEKEKELYELARKKIDEIISILPNPLPDKIFICEDISDESISLWTKFLSELGLKDIQILSSGGSSNSVIENRIQTNIELNINYSPLVFRQIDRDGLTDEQNAKLEDKMNTKYDGLGRGYFFSTLNVNELENYAVIHNHYFDESFFTLHKDHIEDKFENTIDEKLRQLFSFFKYKEEIFDNIPKNRQLMKKNARSNWKLFFPGKDICKKKSNFNGITYLKTLTFQEYPQELKDYLEEIKTFFNS